MRLFNQGPWRTFGVTRDEARMAGHGFKVVFRKGKSLDFLAVLNCKVCICSEMRARLSSSRSL